MKNSISIILFAVVFSLTAQFVHGQQTFNERSDFYVGYQFVRQNVDIDLRNINQNNFRFNDNTDSHGINVAYTYYMGKKTQPMGLTTEVGVNFAKDDHVLATYMSGMTLKRRGGRVQPFIKAVGGMGTLRLRDQFITLNLNRADTGMAFSVGGGLDIKAGKNTALRLFQVDYLQTQLFSTYQHNVRLGAGVTF